MNRGVKTKHLFRKLAEIPLLVVNTGNYNIGSVTYWTVVVYWTRRLTTLFSSDMNSLCDLLDLCLFSFLIHKKI